ncbi:MAG: hypothetical protein ACOCQN_04655 [Halanaerobiaceae bacterium]
MEYKGINIITVFIIILLIISIFFAGKYIFTKLNFEQPLREEIAKLPGTEGIYLHNSSEQITIVLEVGNNINIYKYYNQILTIIDHNLKNQDFQIKLKTDNSNLDDVYYQLQFLIYEGIATQRFTTMKDRFDNIAGEYDLSDYKLWVDESHIYIMLAVSGDSYYKVIPRTGSRGENSG